MMTGHTIQLIDDDDDDDDGIWIHYTNKTYVVSNEHRKFDLLIIHYRKKLSKPDISVFLKNFFFGKIMKF